MKLIMVGLWMLKPFFQLQSPFKLQIGNIKRVYDENTHGQTLLEIKERETG